MPERERNLPPPLMNDDECRRTASHSTPLLSLALYSTVEAKA